MEGKKKIIHVTVTLGGGVGTVIKDLANYQIKEGYKVAILYPDYLSENELLILKELNKNVYLLPIPVKYINGLTQFQGLPIKKIKEQLTHQSEEDEIVFHAHNPAAIGLLNNIKKLPLICTLHGINTQASSISQTITNLIIRKLVKNKINVVGVSDAVSNFYNKKIGEKHIKTILNGSHIKHDYNLKKFEKFSVGFIGHINDLKGWRFVLDAYSLLEEEYKNKIDLVLVGSGSSEEISTLQRLIEEKKLKNNVKFLGQVNNAGQTIMPKLNLIILPSKSEGLPMTLIEAIGHGIPVLATKVGGIPELIIEGYNGYFIERDAIDIANKIKFIFDNKPLYNQLSENSLASYIGNFTTENMNNKYLSIYQLTRKN